MTSSSFYTSSIKQGTLPQDWRLSIQNVR